MFQHFDETYGLVHNSDPGRSGDRECRDVMIVVLLKLPVILVERIHVSQRHCCRILGRRMRCWEHGSKRERKVSEDENVC